MTCSHICSGSDLSEGSNTLSALGQISTRDQTHLGADHNEGSAPLGRGADISRGSATPDNMGGHCEVPNSPNNEWGGLYEGPHSWDNEGASARGPTILENRVLDTSGVQIATH